MNNRTSAIVAISVVILIGVGVLVVYPRLSATAGNTSSTSSGTGAISSSATGSSSPTTSVSGSSTGNPTASSTQETSSQSTLSGNIFTFQPPTLSGGDYPVTAADFASHPGDANEWLEAKIVPYNMSGWIWYVHANFVGATSVDKGIGSM